MLAVHISLLFCTISSLLYASLPQWAVEQIEEDFAPYSKGITKEQIERTLKRAEKQHFMVRIKIIDGIFYQFHQDGRRWRHCLRGSPLIHFFNKMMALIDLPDLDFVYVSPPHGKHEFVDGLGEPIPGPFFNYNKVGGDPHVILYHDVLTVSYPGENGRYLWGKVAKQTEQAIVENPWESKINKLFWNGQPSDFRGEEWKPGQLWTDLSLRGSLYLLGQSYPELMDIRIGEYQEWIQERFGIDLAGIEPFIPATGFLPINVDMGYKYHIVLDGLSCTIPGYAWRLLSNSVCLKVDSPVRQWFYRGLTPGQEYLPVKADFSDLPQTIRYLQEHDEEARQIAESGRTWAQEHLVGDKLLVDYCIAVIQKYASLQAFRPTLTLKQRMYDFPARCFKKVKRLLPAKEADSLSQEDARKLKKLMHEMKCKVAIELSSGLGGNTKILARNLPQDGLLFAIDDWKEEYKQFLSNCIHSGLTRRIVPKKLGVISAADEVCVQAELIFFNGPEMMEQLEAWHTHLRSYGVLCGSHAMSLHPALESFAQRRGYLFASDGTFWKICKAHLEPGFENVLSFISSFHKN